MITLSIMLATIMQTLDLTIANVALPHMQGSLSASQDQIAWVLTAYIVAVAIATPLTGWLVDRFGQKKVFLASVIGFTVASALCGLSNSLLEIVAARLLQGLFGASLVPMSQVVLMEINPPEKQGSAMAFWGMGVTVGPILGPTLGGWLTDSYNWRWVFFINVPVGIIAAFGIWRYIHPARASRRMQFDLFGFTALSVAIGSLQMLLDRGQQNDWFSSNESWAEAIAMVLGFTYFVAHTALTRADKSFFDYRLLKNRNYVTGLLFIFVVGVVLFATRALIPTMLENLLDYPVATTGLVTAPTGIGSALSMLIAGRIVGRVDLRLILFAGFSITALSLWEMTAYSLDLSQSDIVWPGVLQGVGQGLVFVPLAAATFATLSPEMRSQGTAIFSLVRNIGSSIGISMVQTIFVRSTVTAHAGIVEKITYANPAWTNPAVASVYDLHRLSGAAALDGAITQQAAMIAYLNDFRLMLYLTLAVIPLLLILRAPRRSAVVEAHAAMD
ncbi:MAG: DHA2 family efflux MFS transporter permease subunit [Steroidobacteraceae bacterium]